MKLILAFLLALNPSFVFAQAAPGKIDDSTIHVGANAPTNYVKNPSAIFNTAGITTSSATATRDTDTADKLDGKASWVCDASAQNGYCEWDSNTIQEGDKTGNCEAKAIFKGDASLYKLQIHDGSNVLAYSAVLSNATDWTEVSVNYQCGSTRKVRLTQTESGTGAAVNIGRVFWGRATNLGEVAQAQIYGTLTYAGTASCTWSRSGAVGNFSADTDCATPTVTGYASAPATKIPGITFANLPPGKYKVHFDDTQFYCQSSADCYFRITDGTTNTMYKVMNASNAQRMHMLEEVFTYSVAQSNITFQVQAYTGDGNTADIYAHGTGFDFKAVVTYFPSDSQIAIRDNQTPWYIDATMDGANPSLGVTAVSSYTEITDAGLTLKPQSGSAPVGVMCSSTNAATEPSTSNTTCAAGDESLGINFEIKRAGSYEICFYGTLQQYVDSAESINTTLQLIETPTNAQTLTLEGGTRTSSANQGMTIASGADSSIYHAINNCSIFNWTSSGIKGVRLMYEQSVTGTPDFSLMMLDGDTSNGQRNGRWTVKPVTASSPMPLLVGSVTSNSTGLERVERAYITYSAGVPSVTSQSGSWITSVTDNGTGDATLVIPSGIFSSAPSCNATAQASGATNYIAKITSATTTTAASIYVTDHANTAADVNFYIHCQGPR